MKKFVKIEDLDCAHCAAKIEKKINELPEVIDCKVSFMAEKMSVEYKDDENFQEIFNKIVEICKKVEPDAKVSL